LAATVYSVILAVAMNSSVLTPARLIAVAMLRYMDLAAPSRDRRIAAP
jgi:hypothetical protein